MSCATATLRLQFQVNAAWPQRSFLDCMTFFLKLDIAQVLPPMDEAKWVFLVMLQEPLRQFRINPHRYAAGIATHREQLSFH